MRKIKVILMSVLLALFIAGCSSGTSAEFFESGSQISGKTEQSDSGMEVHFIDCRAGRCYFDKSWGSCDADRCG